MSIVQFEVDVSRGSLNRLAIYAALRIPEVWRIEGGQMVCYLLGSDGRYPPSNSSRSFPDLDPAELNPFLAQIDQTEENDLIRQFRAWVRQRFAGGGTVSSIPNPAPAAEKL